MKSTKEFVCKLYVCVCVCMAVCSCIAGMEVEWDETWTGSHTAKAMKEAFVNNQEY